MLTLNGGMPLTIPIDKPSGFVATPEPIARELVRWAVRRADEKVLDLGAGEGVFLVEVGRRLGELGVAPGELRERVLGVEKDPIRYASAVSILRNVFGVEFSGVHQADLFECDFPTIGALVG